MKLGQIALDLPHKRGQNDPARGSVTTALHWHDRNLAPDHAHAIAAERCRQARAKSAFRVLPSTDMDRRQTLGLMGTLLATLSLSRVSRATTARAVSLADLTARSTRIAHALPLENSSRFEDVGDTRHIVTYTRLRVDELISGSPNEPEILVRTLGGRIGKLAELVHGEAVLAINEPCVVFLQADPDGIDNVTEMAQGHYPLLSDASGVLRLQASRNMPHLLGKPDAAVAALSGLQLPEARSLILGARR